MTALRYANGLVLVGLLGNLLTPANAQSPRPTQLIKFAPPTSLPDRVTAGSCGSMSPMAWFRADAVTCTVDKVALDPCFQTNRPDQVLCVGDPREFNKMTLVATKPALGPDIEVPPQRASAWFIELTDGTTCQPLFFRGRELDGLRELYKCKWGSNGEADAVLGDLDESAPVWTIRKVLINKKSEPQTIKSMTIDTVKSVWR